MGFRLKIRLEASDEPDCDATGRPMVGHKGNRLAMGIGLRWSSEIGWVRNTGNCQQTIPGILNGALGETPAPAERIFLSESHLPSASLIPTSTEC